ncbi:hypothetical protein Bbelb_012840 [Branchiostoma belcheri]|nr:hypothetical protein Bbelb_012840 [Branchiostoma belcheri]
MTPCAALSTPIRAVCVWAVSRQRAQRKFWSSVNTVVFRRRRRSGPGGRKITIKPAIGQTERTSVRSPVVSDTAFGLRGWEFESRMSLMLLSRVAVYRTGH